MRDLGNPFQEDNLDLLSLDKKDIARPSAAELLRTHHERGKTRFQEFSEGLEQKEVTIFYEPIKKIRWTSSDSNQPQVMVPSRRC